MKYLGCDSLLLQAGIGARDHPRDDAIDASAVSSEGSGIRINFDERVHTSDFSWWHYTMKLTNIFDAILVVKFWNRTVAGDNLIESSGP